jgi:hypothetical protein
MGWQISVQTNELVIPKEFRSKFVELAEENDQYISIAEKDSNWSKEGNVQFNDDAMEHMDFLWDDWVTELQKEMKAVGDVVFMSAEGDNSGDIWGYSFKEDGTIKRLKGVVNVVEVD